VLAVLSFAAGVLSFASPCTLPILPAYFAFAFQSGRTQIVTNTMAFMLGLATMFSLFGAGASLIGRALQRSTELILLLGGAAILIFGVMSLLGKGFTGMQQQQSQTRATTLGGSYAFGLTFAVGWTSCVGPILGTVLTLAATTGSVSRGIMLLFIYALGLGLPLVVVSAFFGRASRDSLFWRVLRGKGWTVNVPTMVIGLLWALAIWRILVAVFNFVSGSGMIAALPAGDLTLVQEIGVLLVVVLAVALWLFTGREARQTTLYLHSTQLLSGALFALMGLLMLEGALAQFNALIPVDLALWLADVEEQLIALFSR
jgi:cytochrome c-type biogenesis protein